MLLPLQIQLHGPKHYRLLDMIFTQHHSNHPADNKCSFVSAKIGSNDKRMQFVSPSGDVNIRILAERVDVEFTLGTSDTTEEYFTEKLPVASSIMDTILTTLGNVQGNRLAYYADIIIPEVEGSSLQISIKQTI